MTTLRVTLADPLRHVAAHADLYDALPALVAQLFARAAERFPRLDRTLLLRLAEYSVVVGYSVPWMVLSHETGHYRAAKELGWDAEIYAAADGPPATFEDWGEPVGTTSGAADEQLIELDVPEPAQYYLVWLTKLAGSPGEYKVEISEASLTAAS